MLFLLRSLLLVGLTGGLAVVGARAFTDVVDTQFDGIRTHAEIGCKAFRSMPRHVDADVCHPYDRYRSSSFREFKKAASALEAAKRAFALGDSALAHIELQRAVDVADNIDRRSMTIDALLASRIVAGALDIIETQRLSPKDRLALLARVQLSTGEAPLEGERVHDQWTLTHDESSSGPFARVAIANQAREDDVGFAEMQRALLGGDVGRCELALTSRDRPRFGAGICKRMAEVIATQKRLERATAGAIHELESSGEH